ncbi:LysR family transcriptional regulator [Variovorax sp. N23]|uniref:LysR family transcriptional regulator n=1 Tax=Variovorax sp. N23 TaxID=2980555 RepID=UPI0021C8D7E1|nr:LysR family transcriptional regulator [Variovorax sp. N23]MCU4121144.1 LysR family transcriptional regulator [Variovorax sp. N23]
MHLIDLRTLRQFVSVAEHESISRAAEALHMSASPLSRTILQLEARVGFALFDRVNRALRLNNAGRELLLNARQLLRSNETLMRDLQRRADGVGGTVVIGHMAGALYNGIIPGTARRVQAAHPSIAFQFEGAQEPQQLDALRRGRLDFAVQTQEVADPALASRIYSTENYVLLMPRHHALVDVQEITLEQLVDAQWVVTPERNGPSLRAKFMAACHRLRFEPQVACVAGDIVSALALVANEFGLCAAQESLAQFAGEAIVARPLPLLEMQTEYRIVWRPEAVSPPAQRFLDALPQVPHPARARRDAAAKKPARPVRGRPDSSRVRIAKR